MTNLEEAKESLDKTIDAMTFKTTYNAASSAFISFSKGFDENTRFSAIRRTIQIFKKIQDELSSFEKAMKVKVNKFNKFAEENKKTPEMVREKQLKLTKEADKASNNFVLVLDDDEKTTIKSTLEKIKLDGKEDSATLVGIEQFLQDLDQ